MFTKLHSKVSSYKTNKNNTHPVFIENHGLENIVDDIKEELTKALPHGSGIDSDWLVEQGAGLVFSCYNSYHSMDNNGYYCGHVRFEVKIDLNSLEVLSVDVNQQDIKDIEKEYETEEEDPDDLYDNPCPYLNDLGDYLFESITQSLEYYVLEETLAYVKRSHPYLLDKFLRNN
jgi:hypothetical protein